MYVASFLLLPLWAFTCFSLPRCNLVDTICKIQFVRCNLKEAICMMQLACCNCQAQLKLQLNLFFVQLKHFKSTFIFGKKWKYSPPPPSYQKVQISNFGLFDLLTLTPTPILDFFHFLWQVTSVRGPISYRIRFMTHRSFLFSFQFFSPFSGKFN